MAIVTRTTYQSGTTIDPAAVNANENAIFNDYNGNITNANVASGAAIVASKLNLTSIAQTMARSGVADNWAKGADLTSGSTVNIGAASGNMVHITGTTTITAFDTVQAGTWRLLVFDGALTLTHNSTSLILPTGASITTAAGDTALMVSEGSGNWRCVAYNTKSGSPLAAQSLPSGTVVQVVNTNYTSYASLGSTVIPQDDSKPQNTEGNAISSLDTAITPSSSSNKLLITAVCYLSNSSNAIPSCLALFQDSTADALATSLFLGSQVSSICVVLKWYMTAGTTSATTFKLRAGGASGTYHINGTSDGGARLYGGTLVSSLTIEEIKA